MKKFLTFSLFTLTVVFGSLQFPGAAYAEEFKMVGNIIKLEVAADGKSANVVLKDSKSGAEVPIYITDELTLDKFKDKRIVMDDEIRTRYDNESGKNLSKSFKKTAGC